ncbi:MAG: hypothetical protein KDD06_13450 [Phaeodactylibacter sp.]|nr:hypothetical protein [Phaeodactylibacter sp.]
MNEPYSVWRDKQQAARQVVHWTQAALRLEKLDELAAPEAWKGMEQYLDTAVRNSLNATVHRLRRHAIHLQQQMDAANGPVQLQAMQEALGRFRKRYLKVEATLDFFADAINTRTNQDVAALLRACDWMAHQSMTAILKPLGKTAPPVLTYIDKGLGASILKAGLRLWDRDTINPVAAIKIVRHNLLRPTSLIHESGHQVAHLLHWNEELAQVLERQLKRYGASMADTWASWASEITADTFAFVHTGYAAVASLHDVLSGNSNWVFRFSPGDPHPINYLRVRLNTAMCRLCFGPGPWDELEAGWNAIHPLSRAPQEIRSFLSRSAELLPEIAGLCLSYPIRAFQNRPLDGWLPPARIAPEALMQLAQQAGPAMYTSPHWLRKEPLRLLALNGYQLAVNPEKAPELIAAQRQWMLRLGKHTVEYTYPQTIKN